MNAAAVGELEAMLKRLNLANARRVFPDRIQQAESEGWSFHDFLFTLAREEIDHRRETRIQRFTRKARFPALHTFEVFDFSVQPELDATAIGSAFAPDFAAEGRCLILSGRSGRGKTHLATAVAYRAIQNGCDALFTTAAALIDDLAKASAENRMQQALRAYTQPGVLVIDELGYLTYGNHAANTLFHVVNERSLLRRSIVVTTNKPFAQWGTILHDNSLAEAILDRILERGRIILLEGPSMRTRHLAGPEAETMQRL